jgi:hypothetical protein
LEASFECFPAARFDDIDDFFIGGYSLHCFRSSFLA